MVRHASPPGDGVLSSIATIPAGAKVFRAPWYGLWSRRGMYIALVTARRGFTAHNDDSILCRLASKD
ncbi:uncharacterized protein METZ01_LOCUS63184, partial [marine metagenome]